MELLIFVAIFLGGSGLFMAFHNTLNYVTYKELNCEIEKLNNVINHINKENDKKFTELKNQIRQLCPHEKYEVKVLDIYGFPVWVLTDTGTKTIYAEKICKCCGAEFEHMDITEYNQYLDDIKTKEAKETLINKGYEIED